jgi:tetrahydromethanopterin S-methyltransferase subunit B
MATEKVIKLKVENGQAILAVDELNKAMKETNKTADDLENTIEAGSDALDKFTKGGVTAMKGLYKGAQTAIASMMTLKGAIIATGIGALVVIVGTLAAYFTSTSRGADQFAAIMGGVNATINVLRDRVIQIGEAISMLFSGKFLEAAEKAKNAFKGIGDEIARDAKQGVALAKSLDAIEDRERSLIVLRAQSNKEIAKARMIADDTTKSTNERIAAVQKAFKLETEVANAEQKNARAYLKYLDNKIKMEESTDEDLKARAEAQAKVLELETETLRRQKRLQGEVISLRNEEKAKQKEASDARAQATKEEVDRLKEVDKVRKESADKEAAYQKFLTDGEKAYLDTINNRAIARVRALNDFAASLDKIKGISKTEREKELEQLKQDGLAAMRILLENGLGASNQATQLLEAQRLREKEINEKYDKEDEKRQMAANAKKLELAGQAFGALAGLTDLFAKGGEKTARKAFGITKALRLAEAVANTGAAILNQLASTPGPAGFIQAGIAAATGATQIATIARSKFEPNKTTAETPTAPSTSAAGGGGGFTPNISFTGIGQNPLSGIFDRPMQAYVVNQQMNNNNMLERRIRTSANFGG